MEIQIILGLIIILIGIIFILFRKQLSKVEENWTSFLMMTAKKKKIYKKYYKKWGIKKYVGYGILTIIMGLIILTINLLNIRIWRF